MVVSKAVFELTLLTGFGLLESMFGQFYDDHFSDDHLCAVPKTSSEGGGLPVVGSYGGYLVSGKWL